MISMRESVRRPSVRHKNNSENIYPYIAIIIFSIIFLVLLKDWYAYYYDILEIKIEVS